MAFNNQTILKKVNTEITKAEKSLEELRERRAKLTAEIDDQIITLQKKTKDLQALKKQTELDIKREKEKEDRLAILLGKKVAEETVEETEEVEQPVEEEPEEETSETVDESETVEDSVEETEEPEEDKVETSGWFNRR